jgi:hypothetical protein
MKKIIMNLIVLIISVFAFLEVSYAASFTISVGSKNITKGGSTKLTIKGSDVTGRFNISSSNPSVVSISEDRAWIENNSYSITLNAQSVGSATITVTPSGVSDSNGSLVSLSGKSITVSVSLPREKSTDNNLKGLSVDGYEISPEFSKDVTEYKVSVKEDTKSVKINATANDRYASVSGAGEKEVNEGINKFDIVVKSETGVEKIYSLVVEVIDEHPINVTVDGNEYSLVKIRNNFECSDDFEEKDVTINEVSIPGCYNEKLGYTLVGLKNSEGSINSYIYDSNNTKKHYSLYSYAYSSDLKIVILDSKDLPNAEKVTIKIDDKEYKAFKYNNGDRYYVVYGKNIETGEEDFYLYDSKNKTFSSYDQKYISDLINKVSQGKVYFKVIIAFAIALLLSIVCMLYLNSSKKKIIKRIKEDKKEKIEEEENILKDDK